MITKAPRGTKDVVPQESYKWHYIENKIHDLCRRFGEDYVVNSSGGSVVDIIQVTKMLLIFVCIL